MNNQDFINGKYDTHFIEKNQEQLLSEDSCSTCDDMVLIAAYIDYFSKINRIQENNKEFAPAQSRWKKTPYINHF